MLVRKHIISVSSRNKPWCLERSLYESASTLSPERLALLMDNIGEGLDRGESMDLDTIFHEVLDRALSDNDIKIRLLDLALKASNFVQKLLQSLLKMNFQEKHRLKVSRNLYFNAKVSAEATGRIIAFARENVSSSIWDIKLRSHCLLELFGTCGRRDSDILLFVSYALSRKGERRNEILLEWSKRVGEARVSGSGGAARSAEVSVQCDTVDAWECVAESPRNVSNFSDACMDLEPFFIHKMPLSAFFVQELRYMRNYSVVERVLENLKSHKVVYGLFTKIFVQEKGHPGHLGSIVVRTFRADDVEYTKAVFERYFVADEHIAEQALKRFIVETGCSSLSELFYTRCKTVDSRFIESCIVCKDNIALLKRKICSVVKSHYLPFLVKEHDMFEKVVSILEQVSFPIESVVPHFFRNQDVVDKGNLSKLLFLSQRHAATKCTILSIFCSALARMQERMDSEPRMHDAKDEKAGLLQDEAIPVFFQLVSEMRCFHTLEDFAGLFVDVDCSAFLDILLPHGGNAMVDTFLVRSLNEIHGGQQRLLGAYKLVQARIVASRMLHLDDYWSTAARKQIRMDVNDRLGNDEDALHDNAMCEGCGRFITSARLVAHIIACRSSVPCSVAQRILDSRERYREGLAFNGSLIRMKVDTRRVCIYGIFHQYGKGGSCKLFSLVSSRGEKLCLGVSGGIYFIQSSEGPRNSKLRLLGSAEASHQRSVAIEVSGSSVALHSCLGKSSFKIRDVAEIVVGDGFKGIVSRLVLHNCFGYIRNLLDEMDRCEYFLQRLRNLEKKLTYADGLGAYLDSCYPYQLTSKPVKISFSNVMCTRNFEWRENDFVKEHMLRAAEL